MVTLTQAILEKTSPNVCSICYHPKPEYVGSKDFNVSGSDHFEGRRVFADSGMAIPYYQCHHCYFMFTNAFDKWSNAQWCLHVYNESYLLADPPFESERPIRNAQLITGLFHREIQALSILDIGSGSGRMSQELKQLVKHVDSWDPVYENKAMPVGVFDLITSFEVIEHVTHERQYESLINIAKNLNKAPYARILLSTELRQPVHTLDWWYICPRNGHISIHSADSLAILADRAGLRFFSINPSMHLLCWKSSTEKVEEPQNLFSKKN